MSCNNSPENENLGRPADDDADAGGNSWTKTNSVSNVVYSDRQMTFWLKGAAY